MRNSSRPDLGEGGVLEQLDRFPVTLGVIAANVVLFVFCVTRTGGFAFAVPGEVLFQLGSNYYPALPAQPWRLLTSAFLHADVIHLLFNSLAMLIIGRILEVHYGSSRLWTLYVGCALGGSLASAGYHALRDLPIPSVGASGGTVGLVVLGFVYANQHPHRLGGLARQLRQWILIIVVFSIFVGRIDHAAHLGGAAVGALAGWLVQPEPGTDAHPAWTPVAHVLAVLCLASFGAVVWSLRQGGGL